MFSLRDQTDALTLNQSLSHDDPQWSSQSSAAATTTNRSVLSFDEGLIEDFPIYEAGLFLNRIYLWVVFALGFPGNVFAIATSLTLTPRYRSSYYVATLAFVDNVCLICKLLFMTLTRYDVKLGDVGCGMLETLGNATGQQANWLLVAMTTERCIAVTSPFLSRRIRARTHILAVLAMSLVLLALNCHYFRTYGYLYDVSTDHHSCDVIQGQERALLVMDWVNAVVYALLPAAILCVLSVLIARALRSSQTLLRQMTQHSRQVARRERHQRGMTVMVSVTVVVFVLLVTPRPVLSAVLTTRSPPQGSRTEANVRFLEQVFYLMSDSTHAVNFYLYFLSNRRFRRRFADILKRILSPFFCCQRCKEHNCANCCERAEWALDSDEGREGGRSEGGSEISVSFVSRSMISDLSMFSLRDQTDALTLNQSLSHDDPQWSSQSSAAATTTNRSVLSFDEGLIEDFPIYEAGLFLNRIYLWVVFALGFPGNVFAIATSLTLTPRYRSSYYVATLAFVDNVCLICKLLFMTLTRYDVKLGDVGCGMLETLGNATGQQANWLLVAMTTERCIAVTSPFLSRRIRAR
ncbi:uncharacterized protein LOC101849547 [Aplysia californica]|uniref:Uncharacterized protein LOC101849547 n=1 Tax=Aplysia californica TaxID=6500 RepID=A0ABM0JTZ2_APLCA|nr:uncharacterized protein LOC101849547 [Aplysia californica]